MHLTAAVQAVPLYAAEAATGATDAVAEINHRLLQTTANASIGTATHALTGAKAGTAIAKGAAQATVC